MKVLIINHHMDDVLGGSEIQCDIIATHLLKLGNEVVYGVVNAKRENYNKDYVTVPINLRSIKSIIDIIKTINPDLVYWRFDKRYLLKTALLTKLFKKKFVFGVSSYSDCQRWIWTGSKIISSKLLNKSVKTTLKNFARQIIINPLKSFLNYTAFYFIDGAAYLNKSYVGKLPTKNYVQINNSMLYNSEKFIWKKPYIFWVANLKNKKNPELFVEIAKQYKDIDFLMVGKIHDEEYRYFEDPSMLPSNVYYLGQKPVKEVNNILASSLFLVHTCDPEGFGNNFIQAWLQGKPTISIYFDPSGIIEGENIGFVTGNMEQTLYRVSELIENSELRTKMGEKARNYAMSNFNPEINVKKLEKFFKNILGYQK